MESRVTTERIHFFEYYSVEQLDEYLRSALSYSLNIITQSDRFIAWNPYVQEISLLFESLINMPYAYKYNASFCENFDGFKLSKRPALNLIIRLLYPYLMVKFNKYIMGLQPSLKKTILIWIQRLIQLCDLTFKFLYLMDDKKYYSLMYFLMQDSLQRFQERSNLQYAMMALYLVLKFLDFYFQKRQAEVKRSDELIPPRKIQPQNVDQICLICMRVPRAPTVLKMSGQVYCLICLQDKISSQQPVEGNIITDDHIIKIYQ